ncbi:winged helix DNA-binding protein [Streptomyces sp. NPDC003077]|uniref:winged helix DNA-binding protein n=1 Tax=Streptomyces sp. NPDC003077 TaxID=3154443 RepID=UPI0033AFD098
MSHPTHTSEPNPNPPAPKASADALTGAHAKIWSALTTAPGKTSAALAEAAGIGRSTAGKALATLEDSGLARRQRGIPHGKQPMPDQWYPNRTDQPATPSGSNAPTPLREQKEVTPSPDATPAPEKPRSNLTPDKAPATSEAQTEPPTQPAANNTAPEKAVDTTPPRHPDDTPEGAPAAETPASPRLTVPANGGKPRLVPGALRAMVLEHLRAHRHAEFTATAISRVLGKSSGAIANALVTLEKQGHVTQVNDRPRRYQLRASTAR